MARRKISEHTAKQILFQAIGFSYEGASLSIADDREKLHTLSQKQTYVVKVDDGVKKRMKQGLVFLDVSAESIIIKTQKLFDKGYQHVIIEPFLPHPQQSEKYLSLSRVREGIEVLFSEKGGIAIEENQESIKKVLISGNDSIGEIVLPGDLFTRLLLAFNTYHFSFLEINPFVVQDGQISLLDVAAEVDSAAEFFVKGAWSAKDFRTGKTKEKTEEEKAVAVLATKSPSAFSLEVLNPNGSIFMMLSGGGASIVLADEVYNQGYGEELANYGEYSGNPTAEETYLYAKNVLTLLLRSQAKRKVLIIAGGVANFTDVRVTFQGLQRALAEVNDQLRKQQVKIFVRRGGPYQEEGLSNMKNFLENEGLLGIVAGPEMILTEIVKNAREYLYRN